MSDGPSFNWETPHKVPLATRVESVDGTCGGYFKPKSNLPVSRVISVGHVSHQLPPLASFRINTGVVAVLSTPSWSAVRRRASPATYRPQHAPCTKLLPGVILFLISRYSSQSPNHFLSFALPHGQTYMLLHPPVYYLCVSSFFASLAPATLACN